MTRTWVELSGENLPLAEAELAAVCASTRGTAPVPVPAGAGRYREVAWGTVDPAREAARRLALAHRVLEVVGGPGLEAIDMSLASGPERPCLAARFDWIEPPAQADRLLHEVVDRFQSVGGTLELDHPAHRFLLVGSNSNELLLLRELSSIDRNQYEQRRMPRLPFQRPVSLPPRLARAAANLAGAGPGCRIADPFVGTGALLLEAGLLGARLFGVDRDPTMVRGTLQNLTAHQVSADALTVEDAAAGADAVPWPGVDAILTDPPYGRASSSGGEDPVGLIRRVLPRWAERVVPGGRIVLIGPGGDDPLGDPWKRVLAIPDRVHRSLTREFRVYRRADELSTPS
jgi:tRNA (guanine10-N2)-dimethyltransferase